MYSSPDSSSYSRLIWRYPDERLLGVMDYFLKPNCGQYLLNSSEIIEIHGGETAQELHIDDMIWPVFNWAPDKLLQFNVMVAGTDYTEENGATQVVPGSHKWGDDLWREVKPEEIARAAASRIRPLFTLRRRAHRGPTWLLQIRKSGGPVQRFRRVTGERVETSHDGE